MRTSLAVMLSVVALAMLLYGCGQGSAPAEKHSEREGTRQAETNTPEPSAPTLVSGEASGKEQAAHSEADCRLALYVADKNMSRKEALTFWELLDDMIRTMQSPSWTGGDLRNGALDHLAVPRYPECKVREK
jgi:hypothetical protein